jgi:hypothetical protein
LLLRYVEGKAKVGDFAGNFGEQLEVGPVERERLREKHLLGHPVALLERGQVLFVENPFVGRRLVDHHHAATHLRDDVAVVQLERGRLAFRAELPRGGRCGRRRPVDLAAEGKLVGRGVGHGGNLLLGEFLLEVFVEGGPVALVRLSRPDLSITGLSGAGGASGVAGGGVEAEGAGGAALLRS